MPDITVPLPAEPLSARNLARFGMRRGAYDGANKRRFVLFTTHDAAPGNEARHEFDTKRARDQFAIGALTAFLASRKTIYEECGCCGGFHLPRFRGDCRDDVNRFTTDQLDAKHGADGWDYEDLEDAAHG